MTDINALFKALSNAARDTRADYHMTLGGAIKWCDDNKSRNGLRVVFDNGGSPSKVGSYRGYYEDLAISSGGKEMTLAAFEKMLRQARGTEFTGYKGGEFEMGDDTVLWNSEYGMASGCAVMGMTVDDGKVIIITKQVTD